MNLQTEKTAKIEVARKEVKIEDLEKWFIELERVIQEFDILPENFYNMDETGFNIGDFEARHMVVDTSVQTQHQAQPGRQEWTTAVECICADGSSIPPLMIFTGETFVRQWVPMDFDSTWLFTNNTKGWTSHEHGLQWLKRCFEPTIREKANGQYRLLTCDSLSPRLTAVAPEIDPSLELTTPTYQGDVEAIVIGDCIRVCSPHN